jgi:hypothetical protein
MPTQYILKKEDMGHIMADWDDEWKIPPIERGPSETQNPKIYEVDEEEEDGDIHDRGKGPKDTTP